MSAHLLAISVGPVQEFIAAARRTRDLWYGSNLLSEISKATAKAVHDQGGELIFPAPESPADLEPGSSLNVANVILAELRDRDPPRVAGLAKKAAKDHWTHEAARVFERYQEIIQRDLWTAQVDDVIEFAAAWTPLGDDYQQSRRWTMHLLAGRKRARDFLPAKGEKRAGIPKSSLDGLRESVLKHPSQWPEQAWRGLRLQEGEQLDVVGLVKRTAGGKQSYPSVARVAADPWIRGLLAAGKEAELSRLRDECQKLTQKGIHRLVTSEQGYPQYASFPFEGTVAYRSRHRDLRAETQLEPEDLEPLVDCLDDLTKSSGEPSPYLAVLVADGDRMREALSRVERADDHRAFSRQLAEFASMARGIVRDHSGVLVYAGGDDVLAFLPADSALGCARQLHDVFHERMTPWQGKTGAPLTLSVGLAIAHFMDDLEDLLQYGRAAEKHAKGRWVERNGLAVHVIKRGGGPVEMRASWAADPGPDAWLTKLADLQNDQAIPGRVAYDLHQVADDYENWTDPNQVAAVIPRDALRMIQAKQPRASAGLDHVREALARVSDAQGLRRLANELLVARHIATAIRQANGRTPGGEVSS